MVPVSSNLNQYSWVDSNNKLKKYKHILYHMKQWHDKVELKFEIFLELKIIKQMEKQN
jgi:hypothetical protein